jgi:hypothetical protein
MVSLASWTGADVLRRQLFRSPRLHNATRRPLMEGLGAWALIRVARPLFKTEGGRRRRH